MGYMLALLTSWANLWWFFSDLLMVFALPDIRMITFLAIIVIVRTTVTNNIIAECLFY